MSVVLSSLCANAKVSFPLGTFRDPQVAYFPKDAPARDLWALSSLSLPARKTNQHVLREFNNSFGIVTCMELGMKC